MKKARNHDGRGLVYSIGESNSYLQNENLLS